MGMKKREAVIRKVTTQARPKGDKKSDKNLIPFDKIKYRINPKRHNITRYKTGLDSFDNWTQGLPKGMTIFYGSAGCGKSLLARNVSKRAERCLYLACEVLSDAPPHHEYPNVDTIDYTRYRPNYRRALEELDSFIHHMNPTLVVIDSLTTFLSITKKALPESDLREGISKIHSEYEGRVPIIGVSEIRGTGMYRSTAGGEGVKHACSMLIEMDHVLVTYPSDVEAYASEIGEDVYTLRVVKDKHNMANSKPAKVVLDTEGNPQIILGREPTKPKKSVWES